MVAHFAFSNHAPVIVAAGLLPGISATPARAAPTPVNVMNNAANPLFFNTGSAASSGMGSSCSVTGSVDGQLILAIGAPDPMLPEVLMLQAA
jgi:hypothetical protein